ncbi:hypothetical protein ACOI1H_17035 [Loktanella sp. DJP18]|uniref:hypothetical protein n=1 Tax=Loktanella sp. DJP18 TaxID=3409788 RepID=UPI003BB7BD0F
MTRHTSFVLIAALGGFATLAVPTALPAQADLPQVNCADYLAMEDGRRNAIAAVVEGLLEEQTANAAPLDPQVLLDAGIDPASVILPPPPMPGETARVQQEACSAADGDGNVMDVLTATRPDVPHIDDQQG